MRGHVEEYLEQRERRLADGTYRTMRSTLTRFAGWWDSTRKVPRTMRRQDVERYLWGRHECEKRCRGRAHYGPGLYDSCASRTVNRCASQLRGFLDWAFRRGYVEGETVDAALERVRVRKERRLRLERAQLVDLYEGAEDPYHRWVCALAVHTAGRNSELLSLRVGDLDLEAGELDWSRHKTGDHGDVLPVVRELAEEAERWLRFYGASVGSPPRPDWYLVPRRRSVGAPGRLVIYPMVPRSRGLHVIVKEHLARVLRCNVDELRGEGVHTARRSMARLLYERLRRDHHADPASVVQAMLGHSTRAMTERYIGVESGRLERDRLLRGRALLSEE